MMFDGKFQVLKGDTFTTGLKYNHTSAFQQKAELYQGLILKSLEKTGIEPIKCSVIGFGTGPLINVMFRIILDMRKIPLYECTPYIDASEIILMIFVAEQSKVWRITSESPLPTKPPRKSQFSITFQSMKTPSVYNVCSIMRHSDQLHL